jgi:hypothetical protein
MPTLQQLETERERLKNKLAEVGDMRPGSLVGRFRKCGKPSCHCAQRASEAHGPSWSLTRAVEGKTHTKVIPQGGAVEQTRAQIEEYRRFRKLVQELIELNVQICDQKLEEGSVSSVSKKNGSRRRAWGRRRSGS